MTSTGPLASCWRGSTRGHSVDGSRATLFAQLDRPALKPLPARRFQFGEWKRPRVNIDYHIEVERHYYSVPYALAHQEVDVSELDAAQKSSIYCSATFKCAT